MPQKNNQPTAMSRRRLLQGIGILSLGALTSTFFPALKAQAQEMGNSNFVPLSSFLVNRPVNPILAQRYYHALVKNYPEFPAQLATLNQYLHNQSFKDMDAFIAGTPHQDPLYGIATQIVKAWYTGVVGDDQNMELIAYADAMMYLPTKGILVIPTYGWGPDTWGSKPIDPPVNKGTA